MLLFVNATHTIISRTAHERLAALRAVLLRSMSVLVQLVSLANKALDVPQHALHLLGLLGLLQHSFALEVVESESYTASNFLSLLGLVLKSLVHKLLIAERSYQLELNCDEEESDTL